MNEKDFRALHPKMLREIATSSDATKNGLTPAQVAANKHWYGLIDGYDERYADWSAWVTDLQENPRQILPGTEKRKPLSVWGNGPKKTLPPHLPVIMIEAPTRGRPASTDPAMPVLLRLPLGIINRVNEKRGDASLSSFLRTVIESIFSADT